MQNGACNRQRYFQRCKVVWAVEGEIRAFADLQIFKALIKARVVHLGHNEYAGRNAFADGIIDDAAFAENAAIRLRDKGLAQLVDAGARAVHPGNIRNKASCIGNGCHLDHGFEPSMNSTSRRTFMFRRSASS